MKTTDKNVSEIKLYTLEELTDMLNVTVYTLRNYVKSGKLKAAKIVTESGIPMFILNGHDPEILYTLLDGGHVGTYFSAKKKENDQ